MEKSMTILGVAACMIGALGIGIALVAGGVHNALIGALSLYIASVIKKEAKNDKATQPQNSTE